MTLLAMAVVMHDMRVQAVYIALSFHDFYTLHGHCGAHTQYFKQAC